MLVDRKAASTTLLTKPPRTKGLAEAPSLINATLSLVPGTPVGDQLSCEDQRVSAATPVQLSSAQRAGVAIITRPTKSVTVKGKRCGAVIRGPPNTALRDRDKGGDCGFGGAGFMMVFSVRGFPG